MTNTNPNSITLEEWRQIVALPEIQEAWGLSEDETPEHFASVVYGAKFDFLSGAPGYSGDLYILQGDALAGDAPMVLIRNSEGQLQVP